jgi:hypothetical protein
MLTSYSHILTGAPVTGIVPPTPSQLVVACSPTEDVIPSMASDHVVASATMHDFACYPDKGSWEGISLSERTRELLEDSG